ncbi:Spy/CpxP family protein refolding chaperone [Methylomagnum ishizawai]|uniref:Spy/CpxP family protein refolding chaperone n=1 Tax=Methylomagnum ishizawai TaxID=1760988 RepID=UPI001C33CB0A|nr:Spy/CpxP family protein refolding chaperone [Methylomagnum ishizawai]BBL73593.1 hypothetical protein MishRS11D_06910 [Methylomagnum ishizawai]
MKTRPILRRILLSACLLGLPWAASANPPNCAFEGHGGKPGFSPDRLPPFLNGIALDEAQKTKIAELLKTQGEALRGKAETGHQARKKLMELAFSSDYSDDKAKTLVEADAPTLMEVAVGHARLDHAIFELLTPDQRRQAQENMTNFKERFGKP